MSDLLLDSTSSIEDRVNQLRVSAPDVEKSANVAFRNDLL